MWGEARVKPIQAQGELAYVPDFIYALQIVVLTQGLYRMR